jgi:transaldolase
MSLTTARVEEELRSAALEAIAGSGASEAESDPALAKLNALGTRLWLDTGNREEAQSLWRREFSALTTNNTLANQVVQTGAMDAVAQKAVRDLKAENPGIGEEELVMELGFIVNCHIALRLVKAFNVKVSVELHPSVAEDIERSVEYARRYFAVCPERFIIKIPLTPEGYCAVARVRAEGIPVNYTLGFSARQNYLAALLSGPTYVNVFLGRLNAVVADNVLGDGKYVGEKAAMATQDALLDLRRQGRTETLLIAASMRAASQVYDLAGVDVYTMPPKVAKEFLTAQPAPNALSSQVGRAYSVTFAPDADPAFFETLWTISDSFRALSDELTERGGVNLTGADIRQADADHRTGLFRSFSPQEIADIQTQGKIPLLSRWQDTDTALDDLMTMSALRSFAVDQAALDDRLRNLAKSA